MSEETAVVFREQLAGTVTKWSKNIEDFYTGSNNELADDSDFEEVPDMPVLPHNSPKPSSSKTGTCTCCSRYDF